MPNNYYPDLDSNYPNSVDTQDVLIDVDQTTDSVARQYQSYKYQGSLIGNTGLTGFEEAQRLKDEYPVLDRMEITATKWNKMQDAIIAVQRFCRSLKLQTVFTVTKPTGAIKQVVGSIWAKVTNFSTAQTDKCYKVDLHKLENEKGDYIPYYPKTTSDQVIFMEKDGDNLIETNLEDKLKEELDALKELYNIKTYTDIKQIKCTSYILTDIIKAMPNSSIFITGYSPSSAYVSSNKLPVDSGIIKITRTTLNRTELEIINIVDNGGKYVHYHSVYNSSNNTVATWNEVSYKGHIHDDRYYTETEIDKKFKDNKTNFDTELNKKYDKTGGTISGNAAITGTANINGAVTAGDGLTVNPGKSTLSGLTVNGFSKFNGKKNSMSGALDVGGIATFNSATFNETIEAKQDIKVEKNLNIKGSIKCTNANYSQNNASIIDKGEDYISINGSTISAPNHITFARNSTDPDDPGGQPIVTIDDLACDWISSNLFWGLPGSNNSSTGGDVQFAVDTAIRIHGIAGKSYSDPTGHAGAAYTSDWKAVYASSFDVKSDIRSKENVKTIPPKDSLTVISNITPVIYRYKNDKQIHRGLIAQEVRDALKKINVKDQIYVVDKKDDTYMLAYDEMYADLLNVVQTLMHKVDKLEVLAGLKDKPEYKHLANKKFDEHYYRSHADINS